MDVLVTGGTGTVGTAITEHLADRPDYEFTCLDLDEHRDPDVESIVGDARVYEVVREAVEGMDAVVHLAHVRLERGHSMDRSIRWNGAHGDNLELHANVVGAAADAGVDSLVYASSNHAVGLYEVRNAPEVYYPGHGVHVDHTVQPRPDSMYGTEKVYAEGLGRLAAETTDLSFYAIRICAVRDPEYDHPYGDAERGVDRGDFERDSDDYDVRAARLKAMWQSRRDHAHMIDRCLRDSTVDFDVFYGVSDNDRRWFDIEHAREVLGYAPRDNGEEWDGPPAAQ